MKKANITKIELTKEDITNILKQYVETHREIQIDIRFNIKNEMIPGPYPQDGYDNYVLGGATIEITREYE
jgi:hypothetical protein